ncbi:hypothetical protein E3N88_18534 [Mikania micrantha]|uniref:Uncharacterized protein n=1 Tax=Mikania micrantha TaxID=192012 RepID=A0A5N6NNF2_9ASTR|nr:hypothetical protein E3N88_18534 [Mikania micrantha]
MGSDMHQDLRQHMKSRIRDDLHGLPDYLLIFLDFVLLDLTTQEPYSHASKRITGDLSKPSSPRLDAAQVDFHDGSCDEVEWEYIDGSNAAAVFHLKRTSGWIFWFRVYV